MSQNFCIPSSSLHLEHAQSYGHKVRQHISLSQATAHSPNFFVVTPQAFSVYIHHNNLHTTVEKLFTQIDPHDPQELKTLSKNIQKRLNHQQVPKNIAHEISQTYKSLKSEWFTLDISYPSPALFDRPEYSTQLFRGDSTLMHQIREVWVSLFTPKTLHAHSNLAKLVNHFPALIVKEASPPSVTGKIYTVNPLNQNKNQLLLTAAYGVTQGDQPVPDTYVYNRSEERIDEKHIVEQHHQQKHDRFGHLKKQPLPKDKHKEQKLNSQEIKKISKAAIELHHHFLSPQDISFSLNQDRKLTFEKSEPLQTHRLETRLPKIEANNSALNNLSQISSGVAASPGIITAPVRILKSAQDKAQAGEIIVAEAASLKILPSMRKAVGVITESGGVTSHAAILAREIGCPAVTGASGIMRHLKTGQVVTINGTTGKIYKGGHAPQKIVASPAKESAPKETVPVKTATKIYINLFDISQAESLTSEPLDGVGLIRGEFAITDFGYHPLHLVSHKAKEFTTYLSTHLSDISNVFGQRPLFYRFSLANFNEYEHLTHAHQTDHLDPNPLLGFKGAAYHAALPDVFDLEVQAVLRARNKHGAKNLKVVVPFVRTSKELQTLKRHIASAGLHRGGSFEIYAEIGTPAMALALKELQNVNIDGIFLNIDSLAAISLGLDPVNHELQSLYHPLHPAVISLITTALRNAHQLGLKSVVHGQAVNEHPDILEACIQSGVSGICTNAQYATKIKHLIANIERQQVS